MTTASRYIAMLIDGENAHSAHIPNIIQVLSPYGEISIRRVYGDFTERSMRKWREVAQENNIRPIHHFRNTIGKNATDSALIVDAMDILYRERVDGFCIVSSDSDYTRLANRIRESGRFVIGIGQGHTPIAFVRACNAFLYVERLFLADYVQNFSVKAKGIRFSIDNLLEAPRPNSKKKIKKAKKKPALPEKSSNSKPISDFASLLEQAYLALAHEWVNMSQLGYALHELDPNFKPRDYGEKQLSRLVQKLGSIVECRQASNTSHPLLEIRVRINAS
jgi:uncharacterized protein (TIGR00288 family)